MSVMNEKYAHKNVSSLFFIPAEKKQKQQQTEQNGDTEVLIVGLGIGVSSKLEYKPSV